MAAKTAKTYEPKTLSREQLDAAINKVADLDLVQTLTMIANGELITSKIAMERLGIESQGAWQSAINTNDYLKRAIVPQTDFHKRMVLADAVEFYRVNRGSGGGSRNGNKLYNIVVSDDLAKLIQAGDWNAVAALAPNGIDVEKPADRLKRLADAKRTNGGASNDDNGEDTGDDYEDGEDDNG